jgi:hypothetical protein
MRGRWKPMRAALLAAVCLMACCNATAPEPIEVTYGEGLVGFATRLDSLRVQILPYGLG